MTILVFFVVGPVYAYFVSELLQKTKIFEWKEALCFSYATFFLLICLAPKFGVELRNIKYDVALEDDNLIFISLLLAVLLFISGLFIQLTRIINSKKN